MGGFFAACILAGTYLCGGRLRSREAAHEFWERGRWISAAAGVSVAYVFVDVLPELGAHQQAFAAATEGAGVLFAEQRMYALALASFVVFYGLDHMVLSRRAQAGEGTEPELDRVFWLHMTGFALYSGLIGYLLVEREEKGWLALAAYTFVMAVHFLIIGHSLAEEGQKARWLRRWLLASSVLGGWVLGSTVELSETTFARLFAVLAGGVVITSLRHELPGSSKRGRFWPFCFGAAAFALALLATEAAANIAWLANQNCYYGGGDEEVSSMRRHRDFTNSSRSIVR